MDFPSEKLDTTVNGKDVPRLVDTAVVLNAAVRHLKRENVLQTFE